MCLTISSTIHRKLFGKYIPIKLKKDFEVYKFIKVDWSKEGIKNTITSSIQNFTYIINNTYSTRFIICGKYNNEVCDGFHSYTHKSIAESHMPYYSAIFESNGIAICIIPKGSKVFLSAYGEIVSNKIKIIGVEKI